MTGFYVFLKNFAVRNTSKIFITPTLLIGNITGLRASILVQKRCKTLQDFSTEVAFLRSIVRNNKPIKIKPKPDDDPSRASNAAAVLTNLTM